MKNLILLWSLTPCLLFAQVNPTGSENYIHEVKYTEEYSLQELGTAPDGHKIETISYFDGLGRLKQKNRVRFGGANEDLIEVFHYDQHGRKTKNYLPVPVLGSNGQFFQVNNDFFTSNYYVTNFPDDFHDGINKAYQEVRFEQSSLGRFLEVSNVGDSWSIENGHTLKYDYGVNDTEDKVKLLSVNFINGDTQKPVLNLNCGEFYEVSSLRKTIQKNENWTPDQQELNDNTKVLFSNKLGQTVLERTFVDGEIYDLYHVYDRFGNETFTIPPKAVDLLNLDETVAIPQVSVAKSWVEIVDVNRTLADSYNKTMNQLEDDEIRVNTIVEEFGGYGHCEFILENDYSVTLDFDFVLNKPSGLREGVLFKFNSNKRLKDQIIGTLEGEDYQYKFRLENNSVVVSGKGLIQELHQIFSTNINFQCSVDQQVLDNLCYQFKYDQRNRVIEKKIPTKEWQYLVYNRNDQIVLSQDYNQSLVNQWYVTKYDKFGRPAYFALWNDDLSGSRDEVQQLINESDVLFEQRILGNLNSDLNNLLYTNSSFPDESSGDFDILLVNYYDNYSFDELGEYYPSDPNINNNLNSSPTGFLVASKIKVIGTENWIFDVDYYNDKDLKIYSHEFNEYLDLTETKVRTHNFLNQITECIETKNKNLFNVSIVDQFVYDHMGRLSSQFEKINHQDKNRILSYKYSDLGVIEIKKIGGKVVNPQDELISLQDVDYSYNVRGWLSQINDVSDENSNDLFALEIKYDRPEKNESKALFNGNISEIEWRSKIDENGIDNRGYQYYYDSKNRLLEATYFGGSTIPQANNNVENFSVSDISYDKMGNILTLKRFGIHEESSGGAISRNVDVVDDLKYAYGTKSNTLKRIKDNADNGYYLNNSTNEFSGGGGFIMKEDSPIVLYEYDLNGNLIADNNKGIQEISYNHMNLPSLFDLGEDGQIKIVYDALGRKVEKSLYVNEALLNKTQYSNRFVFEGAAGIDPNLKYISNSEGYVMSTGYMEDSYRHYYNFYDQVGSVRLIYSDLNLDNEISISEIIQQRNYYPFGLSHSGYNQINIGEDFKLRTFQTQEHFDQLGLNLINFKWRNHDPAIGRFFNVDPISIKFPDNSVYAFSENRVIDAFELEGLESVLINSGEEFQTGPVTDQKAIEVVDPQLNEGDYIIELPDGSAVSEPITVTRNKDELNFADIDPDIKVEELYQPYNFEPYASVGGVLENKLDGASVAFFKQNGTKFYPKFYASGWGGGSRAQIKTYKTSNVSTALKWGGRGLSAYNLYAIDKQRRLGLITNYQAGLEHFSNAVGTFAPGYSGIAWGAGWESGRWIAQTEPYLDFKFWFQSDVLGWNVSRATICTACPPPEPF